MKKWIYSIEDAIGVSIYCDKKDNYKYKIEDDDQTESEYVNWSVNALRLENIMSQYKDLHDRILLEDIPTANQTLEKILSAMKSLNTLKITYKPFWDHEPHIFEAKPYALKVYNRRWYLIAARDDKNEERNYALDRIIDVSITEKDFFVPSSFSITKKFENCIGIINNDDIPVQNIRLKVFADTDKYLKNLPHSTPLNKSKNKAKTTPSSP